MRRVGLLALVAAMALLPGTVIGASAPHVVVRDLNKVRFKAVFVQDWVHVRKVPADIVLNANFYWQDSPLGIIIKEGRLINRGLRNKPPRVALMVQKINGQQRVRITEVWERHGKIYSKAGRHDFVQTLVQAGPRLVSHGKVTVNRQREGFRQDVSRRTHHVGLGITADGRLLIVGQSNVTLHEFARTFVRLGARDAMNLDGGHSATMCVNGRLRMGSGRILAGLAINTPGG